MTVPHTRRWTAAEVARLRQLAADGLGYAAIGKRLNRPANSVAGKCDRLGIVIPARTPAQKTAIAKKSLAGRVVNNGGIDPFSGNRPYTEDELSTIRNMFAEGATFPAIAAEIGRTTKSVRRRAKAMGLPPRQPGRPAKSRPQTLQFDAGVGRPPSPPQAIPLSDLPASAPGAVSIADAGYRHCRRPIAWPDPITAEAPIFCGQRTVEGKSWCAVHCTEVFDQRPPRGFSSDYGQLAFLARAR